MILEPKIELDIRFGVVSCEKAKHSRCIDDYHEQEVHKKIEDPYVGEVAANFSNSLIIPTIEYTELIHAEY